MFGIPVYATRAPPATAAELSPKQPPLRRWTRQLANR
jgi:hypothetical protein